MVNASVHECPASGKSCFKCQDVAVYGIALADNE